MQKRAAKWAYIRRLEAGATETMPLVPRTPMALEIACCALTNRVTRSFTPVRTEATVSGGHGLEEQEMLVEGSVTGATCNDLVYLFDLATSGARMRQPPPG
jgi:hypothetical protein